MQPRLTDAQRQLLESIPYRWADVPTSIVRKPPDIDALRAMKLVAVRMVGRPPRQTRQWRRLSSTSRARA